MQQFDITFINACALCENKDNEEKEELYYHVDLVLNSVLKYSVKIVLGDFNANISEETGQSWGSSVFMKRAMVCD